jgi:signal transduction histidine kinase
LSDISALRELDRLKSAFVANVSHELRSPLSTIHEQLALVIRDQANGNSAADLPLLNRAMEKTSDLIALVGDLLDLSRIESGTAYTDRRPVDLEELLRSIVSFLSGKAEKRGQTLALEVSAGPLPPLLTDPFALEGIFGNLITNALNYTPEGGTIRVTASPGQGGIEVSVIDNGLGIEAQDLNRIFERFYRVKSRQTRNIPGTGLGLPIVKGLLDVLGGSITVRSSPGKGSVFIVLLPVPASDSAAQAG